MAVESEGSLCVLQPGWEGPVRKHHFHPLPRELDAIPEHAQVVHGGASDGGPAPNSCKRPPDCFDYVACEVGSSLQSHIMQVDQIVLTMIEEIYSGGGNRVADSVVQLRVESRWELERLARILVEKAFAEPQYSEACAVLACTLQRYLPSVPRSTSRPGKKVEKFMHALLDVFQTVFEDIFFNPTEQLDKTNDDLAQERDIRKRTTLQFAGHLHRLGLLGEKVVSQMVHDLIDSGAVEVARELLRSVGIVLDHPENEGRGTTSTL